MRCSKSEIFTVSLLDEGQFIALPHYFKQDTTERLHQSIRLLRSPSNAFRACRCSARSPPTVEMPADDTAPLVFSIGGRAKTAPLTDIFQRTFDSPAHSRKKIAKTLRASLQN